LPSLFRNSVFAGSSDHLGEAFTWKMPQQTLWIWLVVLWFVGVFLWLARLPYAQKVSIEGIVQPRSAPVVVRAPASGVVHSIRVKQGQNVVDQQALVLIDQRVVRDSGLSDAQAQINQLREEQRLLHELDDQLGQRHQQERALILDQLASGRAQVEILGQQVDLARAQVEDATRQLARMSQLAAQQWVSAAELQTTRQTVLTGQQMALDRMGKLHVMQAAQKTLATRLKIMQHDLHAAHLKNQIRLRNLQHQLDRVEVSKYRLVTAPVQGAVAELGLDRGQYLLAGEALLTIVRTEGGHPPIDILLPSSAAAKVRAGMQVRIRYAGYDFQSHGAGAGYVDYLSEVSSPDQSTSLFRARIAVTDVPSTIDRVSAGMQASVDIVLHTKPLWRWVLQPLQSAMARL